MNTYLDLFVIAVYIIAIFVISIKISSKKSSSHGANEQYLAGNSLTFIESICSIIATEVSALTFLGIPAFAYNKNFSFLQIYIGAIVGRFIIARYFIPRVWGKGLTLYQVITGEDGKKSGQKTIAALYMISKTLSVGVRLFSGSILVSTFSGLNVYMGLILTTFITFCYTLIGGLKAVVQTDILQMFLFILGGVVAHFLIPSVAQSDWSTMMSTAFASQKLEIFNFSNPMSILAGLMGGILFDMSTHGVDQDFAQRFMATKSPQIGQKAIFFSSFISISVGALFLGVGALLWTFYQTHPFPQNVPNADHLFAHFIVTYFPVGVRGLMVAGVLAATMSTLDSTINALSATIHNDLFPNRNKGHFNKFLFIDNLVMTTLLLAVAIVASQNGQLLMLGLKIQSWTAGALLSLFMSRILFKKYFTYSFNFKSVITAYIFGISGVALNTLVFDFDWNWNTYWGCGMGLISLYMYQFTNVIPFGNRR